MANASLILYLNSNNRSHLRGENMEVWWRIAGKDDHLTDFILSGLRTTWFRTTVFIYFIFILYFLNIYFIFILGTRDTIARTLETVELKTVGEGAWPQLAFMMKGHYTNIEVKISKIFITEKWIRNRSIFSSHFPKYVVSLFARFIRAANSFVNLKLFWKSKRCWQCLLLNII